MMNMRQFTLYLLMSLVIIFSLTGCKVKEQKTYLEGETTTVESSKEVHLRNSGNRQYLTKTVYNATVSTTDDLEEVLFDESDFEESVVDDNAFRYDKIKVIDGYSFKAVLNFDLVPYFEEDYKGQEMDVIISIFHLHNPDNDAWYAQSMIIFKTDTEIVGFLCPQMGMIGYGNQYLRINNLYYESPMILTKDEVVKYYEDGDHFYTFSADLSNNEDIKLVITHEEVFVTERETVDIQIISGYTKIEPSEVLDIMELTKIEKVEVTATITGFDEGRNRLLIRSEEAETLESVFTTSLYDLNRRQIQRYHLDEGDQIKVYYYKRYKSYQPIDIYVSQIVVDKEVIDIKATITAIDRETRRLTVTSNDLESLTTVNYTTYHTILDFKGEVVYFESLEVGDTIEVYYSKKQGQEPPVEISVEAIKVEKATYNFTTIIESIDYETGIIGTSEDQLELKTIKPSLDAIFDMSNNPISFDLLEVGDSMIVVITQRGGHESLDNITVDKVFVDKEILEANATINGIDLENKRLEVSSEDLTALEVVHYKGSSSITVRQMMTPLL
jgi:Cu/Ag efflux protein CusF